MAVLSEGFVGIPADAPSLRTSPDEPAFVGALNGPSAAVWRRTVAWEALPCAERWRTLVPVSAARTEAA